MRFPEVDRRWLHQAVEAALDRGSVLVTGEPGVGKTSLLDALARRHPDWLSHFPRRDSRTPLTGGDVQSFLLAIGHQLARRRPELFEPERLGVVVRQRVERVQQGGRVVGIRIEDLTASPFHRTAVLTVEQRLGTVAGEAHGVEIGHATLEPRLLEPDNLAHLALFDPAEALRALDPAARIVILVDALDELAGGSLLDWLASGPALPGNVRLVLSSRPHTALGPLRAARADQLTEVPIDPAAPEVGADLLAFAAQALPEEAQRTAVAKAAGNFLYLATYARALAEAEPELRERLLAFAELPAGLPGLYGFFLETARADLQRLGMVEIRDAPGQLTETWTGVGQPLLGLLTVAREPLTVDELLAVGGIRVWPRVARAVLARLRWLLTEHGDRLSLYHGSIAEFLRSEAARQAHPACAIEETEWHQRIANRYRGGAASWSAVDFAALDRYGLRHLPEHVIRAGDAFAATAPELICPGLYRALAATRDGTAHFARCVDLIAGQLHARATPADLPTTLYLGVVRRQLDRIRRGLTPAVLGLLARQGRAEEALDHLAALPPSRQQFESAWEIHQHHPIPDLLADTALTIPAKEIARGYPPQALPLERAAEELVPADLPRALRLWNRAQRDQEGESVWPPDALHRRAAAHADPAEARAHIAQLRTGQATALLDLAARVDPVAAQQLHAEAAAALATALPAERLPVLARLVALGHAEHLPRLHEEAQREPESEYQPLRDLATGLVDAAGTPGLDRPLAAWLLARADTLPISGFTDSAHLAAARQWFRWGVRDRGMSVLERLIAWNRTAWTISRAAAVLAEFDHAAGHRMLGRAHATVTPAESAHGFLSVSRRESELSTLAEALTPFNPGEALATARQMPERAWDFLDRDRATTLARIALRLPREQAEPVLAEILHTTTQAPALVDPPDTGLYRPATGAAPDPRAQLELIPFQHNHGRDWHRLRDERFHTDPADVVRAVTPGSWSIGNPHSWARVLRTLAETLAPTDPQQAFDILSLLADPAERAVVVAALFHTRPSPEIFQAVTRSLPAIPPYDWQLPDQDDSPFAYLRPDHRARFDLALHLIPYEADPALQLLSGTPYLAYAFQLSFAAFASAHATEAPIFHQVHTTTLAAIDPPEGGDPLLTDLLRALACVHEHRHNTSPAPPPRITDPRYATLVALATGDPQFPDRFRALLPTKQLPAATGLVAFAAELGIGNPTQLQALCAEAITAANATSAPIRVITLLPLALSPAFPVDPADLLTDALRLDERDPFARMERDEALIKLFAPLLTQQPALALASLYRDLATDWAHAMARLEHAARPILATLGAEAGQVLHAALCRALACVSPDSQIPSTVDGARGS